MSKTSTALQFSRMLMRQKKYWILPIVLTLVVLGAILVFAESSAIAPFIYTMF